jgi:hypothetical protein
MIDGHERMDRPYHSMLVLRHKVRRKEEALVDRVVGSDLVGHAFVEDRLAVELAPVVEEQDLVHLEHRFLT